MSKIFIITDDIDWVNPLVGHPVHIRLVYFDGPVGQLTFDVYIIYNDTALQLVTISFFFNSSRLDVPFGGTLYVYSIHIYVYYITWTHDDELVFHKHTYVKT